MKKILFKSTFVLSSLLVMGSSLTTTYADELTYEEEIELLEKQQEEVLTKLTELEDVATFKPLVELEEEVDELKTEIEEKEKVTKIYQDDEKKTITRKRGLVHSKKADLIQTIKRGHTEEKEEIAAKLEEKEGNLEELKGKVSDGTMKAELEKQLEELVTKENEVIDKYNAEILAQNRQATFNQAREFAHNIVVNTDSETVNTVLEFAKNKVGLPYVWGGTTDNGYDCSGLVQAAYRQVGFNMPRTTYSMEKDLIYNGRGSVVVTSEDSVIDTGKIQAGDIVYMSNSSAIGTSYHTGLVFSVEDNGTVNLLHASCPSIGIVIEPMDLSGNVYPHYRFIRPNI